MKNYYPLVSVLVLNWNRLEDTKRAITSILNQTYTNFEIVVIDNASTEPDSDSLPALFPKIQFHKMVKNYGCPGGRNKGIELCKGDYIFFVDNDGILDKRAIENAYNVFKKNENVGIVTGRIFLFKTINEVKENSPCNNEEGYYTATFNGGVAMHKRSIYENIGLFNADFMYGHEESNFSMRLLTINKYVYYSDNVILWHKESPIARDKAFNYVSRYINKLVTYWEILPLKQYLLFSFYYLFKYPFDCYKNKCLMLFLKNIPPAFKRAFKAKKESKIRLTNKEFELFQYLSTHKLNNIKNIENGV